MKRLLLQSFIAVLAGNAVYFVALYFHLPASWRHQPATLDLGLLLDFAICAVFYLLVRSLWPARRRNVRVSS